MVTVGTELAELGVKAASALTTEVVGRGTDRLLPVVTVLRDLLPNGLLRGGTVAVTARGSGATSLVLALLAEPSRTGAWCAVIGAGGLSLAAAVGAGVVLDRLALVADPGPDPAAIIATMLDGFDLVAVAGPALPAGVCGRLSARARHSGSVLVAMSAWPGANLTLSADGGTWFGRRRLRCRQLTVTVSGRGAADRPRRGEVWLPADPDFLATTTVTDDVDAPRRLQVVR
jgi:hypothetical protein